MAFNTLTGLDCNYCERKWFLGESGVCNETLGLCICPEGFSGRDSWVVSNTCHVNEKLARGIYICLSCLCLISLVITFASIAYFSKDFDAMGWGDRVRRVKDLNLCFLVFSALFISLYLTVTLLFSFEGDNGNISFIDYPVALPVLLGLGSICLSIAFNVLYYAWYCSLPDPRKYGHISGHSNIFMKRPNLVYKLCIFSIVTWMLGVSITLFILPFVSDDEESFGRTPTIVYSFFLPFGFLTNSFYALFIVKELILLYTAAKQMASPETAEMARNSQAGMRILINPIEKHYDEFKTLLRALFFAKYILLVEIVGCVTCSVVWIAVGGLYQYLLPVIIAGTAVILSPMAQAVTYWVTVRIPLF